MKKLKELNFVKINPAGNITLLYNIKNIDKNEIQRISKISMGELNLYAEQVGFINDTHLQMMGGEFCGNACRSFAAYLAFNDISFQREKIYKITCSGEISELNVKVTASEVDNIFLSQIKMPKNISIKMINLELLKEETKEMCEIIFEGIVHFIIEALPNKEIIDKIRNYCKKKKYLAFGIMFFDYNKSFMTPYVEIQGFDGVWENSCGSGTTALGYYLKEYKNVEFAKIIQPGGWLEVCYRNGEISIDGPVEIIAEGISYINL